MKMLKTLLFYTLVFYALFIHQNTASAREEIPDFEFDDDHVPGTRPQPFSRESSFTFDDFDDFFLDDGSEPEYDIATKEKLLHRALFKALAAKDLKYKFSEVLPLLRALSKSQRTVFASIISAQINGGKSLTLEEVRKRVLLKM
jgi:hypothetical protein